MYSILLFLSLISVDVPNAPAGQDEIASTPKPANAKVEILRGKVAKIKLRKKDARPLNERRFQTVTLHGEPFILQGTLLSNRKKRPLGKPFDMKKSLKTFDEICRELNAKIARRGRAREVDYFEIQLVRGTIIGKIDVYFRDVPKAN